MWQLPLDADTRELIDLDEFSMLRELKDAQFRLDLAVYLGDAWQQVAHTPTMMLRDLYPKVYYYGPRADLVEILGNKLAAAYARDGERVLRGMPSYSLITGEEDEHFIARAAIAFRPPADWANEYLGGLNAVIANIASAGGAGLTENEWTMIKSGIKDLLDFHLKLDLVPATEFFTAIKRDHLAYITTWGLQ